MSRHLWLLCATALFLCAALWAGAAKGRKLSLLAPSAVVLFGLAALSREYDKSGLAFVVLNLIGVAVVAAYLIGLKKHRDDVSTPKRDV